jgi:Cu(I)/Ag(I) efflux system periplasmic protein CusF
MKRVFTPALVLALSVSIVPLARAQSGGMEGMDMKGMPMKSEAKTGETHKGTGTVKSVDAKKRTVKLAHEPIQSMKWPAMTMTFKAKDRAILDKVKAGDKVEFSFTQSGKDYVLTEIK